MLLQPVDAGGIDADLPGRRIIVARGADGVRHAVVVELPDPDGPSTGTAEGLGEADLLGHRLAEDFRVGEDAGAVRIEPGEHRVPARATQGEGAVGPLEAYAPGREAINVRRPCLWIAVAAEHRVQVIRDEEQHVAGAGVRRADGGNGGRQAENAERQPAPNRTGVGVHHGSEPEPAG
jgi:hypothetical protein